MKGVRGECDRQHITWAEDYRPVKRLPQFGDFELSNFIVNDLLVTMRNPSFRPFNLSVTQMRAPVLRQQWLLYDCLCADSIMGSFDDCLFSVHKPQIIDLSMQNELRKSWSKLSNLKVYGLSIDHVLHSGGVTGPLSFITKGLLDLDLHFLVPHNTYDEDLFDKILGEIDGLRGVTQKKIESFIKSENMISLKTMRHYGKRTAEQVTQTTKKALEVESHPILDQNQSSIVLLIKMKIKDLKASVPLHTEQLSYMSNALIRPVVGFMNANKTLIPLTLSAQMEVNSFDGAWDIYAAGLADLISEEMGRAISKLVNDEGEKSKRLRQIGYWQIGEISQMLLDFLEPRDVRSWADLEESSGF